MVDENNVAVDQSNGKIANEILTSACVTQALGVTAGLAGFIYYLIGSANYSGTKNFVSLFWPIGAAYVIIPVLFFGFWLIRSNIFDGPFTPRVALWCIYIFFILLDTILLGFLVWNSGGPSGSIFLPIFLLIPAVATCYCKPHKWCFGAAIILVTLTFSFLAFAEFRGYIPNANQIPSKILQPTALVTALNAAVSIFCIWTAAFCYWLTDKTRKKVRSNNCHPGTCEPFYL